MLLVLKGRLAKDGSFPFATPPFGTVGRLKFAARRTVVAEIVRFRTRRQRDPESDDFGYKRFVFDRELFCNVFWLEHFE